MNNDPTKDTVFYSQTDCEDGGGFNEKGRLANRILVLNHDTLAPQFQKPEYQLAAVEFVDYETMECQMPFDGSSEYIDISEALGVLKDECWPQWLLEKAANSPFPFLSGAEASVLFVPEDEDPGRPPLSERLEGYRDSPKFNEDVSWAANERWLCGEPELGLHQLRAGVLSAKKEMLQNEIKCELEGHVLNEEADGENGSSTLSCDRCGDSQTFYW